MNFWEEAKVIPFSKNWQSCLINNSEKIGNTEIPTALKPKLLFIHNLTKDFLKRKQHFWCTKDFSKSCVSQYFYEPSVICDWFRFSEKYKNFQTGFNENCAALASVFERFLEQIAISAF